MSCITLSFLLFQGGVDQLLFTILWPLFLASVLIVTIVTFIIAMKAIFRQPKKSQPPPKPLANTAIFISYRREDASDAAGRIYDRLTQYFGRNSVFKDVDNIPLGTDFRKHLDDHVGRCHVLLVVIGKQWLVGNFGQRRIDDERDFVRIEIEAALQRDIPVVPVLVQNAPIPPAENLSETMKSLMYRQGIPVRPDPD